MSEEERKIIEQNIVFKDTLLEITPELMKKTIVKQEQEIERLNNIIKEAREYIGNNSYFKDNTVKTMIFKDYSNGILEILDKENKKC